MVRVRVRVRVRVTGVGVRVTLRGNIEQIITYGSGDTVRVISKVRVRGRVTGLDRWIGWI